MSMGELKNCFVIVEANDAQDALDKAQNDEEEYEEYEWEYPALSERLEGDG